MLQSEGDGKLKDILALGPWQKFGLQNMTREVYNTGVFILF